MKADVISPTLARWIEEQTCVLCNEAPAVEGHHYPTRGALGYRCDVMQAATCRACHDACHAGRIPVEEQLLAVSHTLELFWRRAPRELRARVLAEWSDHEAA